MSPPGQDNPAAAPAGGLGPHEDSRALQGEPATALAESPDTDVRFPLLFGNVTPAFAGEHGPEELSAAVQGAPALTAPVPPRLGPRLPIPNGRRERDGPDLCLPKPWARKRGHSSRSCVSPPLQGLWGGGMAEGQRGFPDPDTGSVLQPGPRAPPWQSSSSTADRLDPSGPVTLTAPGGGQTARQGPQRTSGC